MLDTSIMPGTNVVTGRYAGGVTAEQMEHVRDQLRTVVATHGSARLLVDFGDIDWSQIEPRAMWEDLKLVGMVDRLDRYAVVTDKDWLDRLATVADKVTPFEFRVFPTERREEAVAWVTG